MAYKYDPVSKTFIDADAKFSFEEAPNYDELYYQANLIKIKSILNNEKDDDNVAAVATIEEADYILKNMSTPTPFKDPKEALFGIGNFISNYSSNIYEAHRVARIINEFRNINIQATEYVGPNGNVYIRLSEHAGVRAYLNGTRYLINNPRILYMGVGTQGMNNISVGATRFAIVFSAAYRVVELIFKSEYTLVDFFVNITMDMAKLAISTQISTTIVGSLTTAGLITGGSVIVISVGIFLLGAAIAYALYKLDDEFQISTSIIKALKTHRPRKPETPYHPDQFFSQWGRFSRG
ncbi:hypothetical protein [Providencia rettgeri]|uniref:hypothetical protein n=1 Tax=Providencia TaxID=586 RepID=UPI001BD3C60F|nr:hypothetical protein [Providencia rettgeri]ELR5070477.1 hypothetical protein [Providencia rettgeri]ELR5222371.1 hypothetical protein [Providencia rettgeri]MDX7322308.1 hypothetical protein [Providencia rettgeri]